MEYTPSVPAPPQPPPPTYELKKDATGKPPPVRGPQKLKDSRGNEFAVPFPPNPKCKKCHGRGYVGHTSIAAHVDGLIICVKCYPLYKDPIFPVPAKVEDEQQ